MKNLTGYLRSDEFKEPIVYSELVCLNKKVNEIVDYLNQPLSEMTKAIYLQGYMEGKQNPLLDSPQNRLSIKYAIKLMEIGGTPKLIGFINRFHEDPDSLFQEGIK